jgi:hypothetical protein
LTDHPTLETLRQAFHLGMSHGEFYATCDDLLPLKMTVLAPEVLGIHVTEGGYVSFFVTESKGLFHAEYQGDDFALSPKPDA